MWAPRWWRKRKAEKQQMIIAQGMVELHYMAVTAHGRYQLQWVIAYTDEDEVPDIVKGLYEFFIQHAPVAEYAVWN